MVSSVYCLAFRLALSTDLLILRFALRFRDSELSLAWSPASPENLAALRLALSTTAFALMFASSVFFSSPSLFLLLLIVRSRCFLILVPNSDEILATNDLSLSLHLW